MDALDMNRFIRVSQLAVILLYIALVQVFTILGNPHSKVMLFPEAWSRSQCRSLERMVEVEQEYPGGVEHIYNPGCVPLRRCSGCCNDDKLTCFPASTHNISIQLLRITPSERSREYVLLSFLEHRSCPEDSTRDTSRGGGRASAGGGGEEGRTGIETQPGSDEHFGK
ncbi:snake venom vascular endothelial growth factor toxin ICPP isoform X6 [Puntigrus tetrazona]|uniref:snake venom vascular endothelial growth factor toxin ICPP isoform X6 n=1 Tax=Puntigrus tetrazona TaxID=1606681 RepID=UPI001C8B05B4|nr:snake venom vascular endothelial growth factor toxin ICPP isoform X6 [Puntigrus tetrazona]